jgi:membrane protein DedA with SNARE-associated domain
MELIPEFLVRHGYLFLAVFVFAEQVGLPVPSVPVLLAGGALARTGELSLAGVVALGVVAAVVSDVIWYEIGRRRGGKVMNLLCRISLEPDSCVRRTEGFFARHGARTLVVAKFLPGLNTAAPPLAGVFGMRLRRFLAFDLAGAVAWVGAFVGLGWLCGNQLERLTAAVVGTGVRVGLILAAVFAAYLLFKFVQRQRFLRELRVARIAPEELHRKIEAGEEVMVVDLRHSIEFEASPDSVPGALHLPVEEFERRRGEIAGDREVVLLCT